MTFGLHQISPNQIPSLSKMFQTPYKYNDYDRLHLKESSKKKQDPVQKTNAYYEMLKDEGIDVDPCEFETVVSDDTILPVKPLYYDGSIPVFSTKQLEWCQPEEYGCFEYLVVEKPDAFVLDYKQEVELRKRPTHFYCRLYRFKIALMQLMCMHGYVPTYVIDACKKIKLGDGLMVWDQIRNVLKKHKWRIYYNRIPIILRQLGYQNKPFQFSDSRFDDILHDFERMHHAFNEIKMDTGRKYFPNLRYVALRLMDKFGIKLKYTIPLLRVGKKKIVLDQIYDQIWEHVIDTECSALIEDFSQ